MADEGRVTGGFLQICFPRGKCVQRPPCFGDEVANPTLAGLPSTLSRGTLLGLDVERADGQKWPVGHPV